MSRTMTFGVLSMSKQYFHWRFALLQAGILLNGLFNTLGLHRTVLLERCSLLKQTTSGRMSRMSHELQSCQSRSPFPCSATGPRPVASPRVHALTMTEDVETIFGKLTMRLTPRVRLRTVATGTWQKGEAQWRTPLDVS